MDIEFWQPTNSIGRAATVRHTVNDQPILINFYWSGTDLAVDPQTDQQLQEQINIFMSEHRLVNPNNRDVFYLQRSGNDFIEITTDPGWIPPARA